MHCRVLNFIVGCVLLFSCSPLWAQVEADRFSGLINIELDADSLSFITNIGGETDPNTILSQLNKRFPELRIIVVEEKIERKELRGPKIHWRDQRISAADVAPYRKYLKTVFQNIGFFIAPGKIMEGIPMRPLSRFPLMVLKDRSQRHAIFHEVIHYLQSSAANKIVLPQVSDLDERMKLEGIYDSSGKEVYVDAFLLDHQSAFQWSKSEICFRVSYLRQNLQVLGSLLDELQSRGIDELQRLHRSVLYEAKYRAFSMSHKLDPCFF